MKEEDKWIIIKGIVGACLLYIGLIILNDYLSYTTWSLVGAIIWIISLWIYGLYGLVPFVRLFLIEEEKE